MKIFGSVSGKQVDEFAVALVADIAAGYPPTPDQPGTRRSWHRNVASLLEGALDRAVEFKKQHKLGIYKTARLSNTFRWELKERGYSEEFIDALVKDLVVRLSVK